MNERDLQIMKAMAEVLNEKLQEYDDVIKRQGQLIEKLQTDVEGLISLLGEQ